MLPLVWVAQLTTGGRENSNQWFFLYQRASVGAGSFVVVYITLVFVESNIHGGLVHVVAKQIRASGESSVAQRSMSVHIIAPPDTHPQIEWLSLYTTAPVHARQRISATQADRQEVGYIGVCHQTLCKAFSNSLKASAAEPQDDWKPDPLCLRRGGRTLPVSCPRKPLTRSYKSREPCPEFAGRQPILLPSAGPPYEPVSTLHPLRG